jgi:hypothetical protein
MSKSSSKVVHPSGERPRLAYRERPLLVIDDEDPASTAQLTIMLSPDGAVFEASGRDESGLLRSISVGVSAEDFEKLVERLWQHRSVVMQLRRGQP